MNTSCNNSNLMQNETSFSHATVTFVRISYFDLYSAWRWFIENWNLSLMII